MATKPAQNQPTFFSLKTHSLLKLNTNYHVLQATGVFCVIVFQWKQVKLNGDQSHSSNIIQIQEYERLPEEAVIREQGINTE